MGDVPLAFVETVGGVRVSEDDPVAVGKNDVSVDWSVYEALLMCITRFCLSRSGEHDLTLRLSIRPAKAVSIISGSSKAGSTDQCSSRSTSGDRTIVIHKYMGSTQLDAWSTCRHTICTEDLRIMLSMKHYQCYMPYNIHPYFIGCSALSHHKRLDSNIIQSSIFIDLFPFLHSHA